jgi:hypothetical protein
MRGGTVGLRTFRAESTEVNTSEGSTLGEDRPLGVRVKPTLAARTARVLKSLESQLGVTCDVGANDKKGRLGRRGLPATARGKPL